jgi:drug/metabolite transporter (DMT)-like permease
MAVTTAPPDAWSRNGSLVAVAVGYQWFYNGINFLAFKVSGDAMHPMMVATLRFGGAAMLILPVALWRFRSHPATARQLASAAAIGVVMLVAGQTLSIWATHFLPAGVASVFGSAPPLFLALFAWLVFRQPLARRQVAGVAVGFAGLALMGLSSAGNAGFHVAGAALALVASAAWAAGSLLAARVALPSDPVVGLAAQLVAAGLLLAAISGATGIMSQAEFSRVPLPAWGSLAFLILASTLIGYAVFLALNRAVSPTLANTYNYVAPVIALGLSALLLGEPLTWFKVVAAAVALVGVTLMLSMRLSPAAAAR